MCQEQSQPDLFSSELLFVSGQLRVIVSRLEALAERPEVRAKPQTARVMDRWVQDARFLLAEIGEP